MPGIEFEETFGHLVYYGMYELDLATDIHQVPVIDQPTRVVHGLRLLGRALRGFAAMGHRCTAPLVHNRLGRHANRLLFELNESHVANDTEGVWELHVPVMVGDNETFVDVGAALRRASKAVIHEERYRQAGVSFALALVYAAGGDDGEGDEPLAGLDVWGGFARVDPHGKIRTTDELEVYFQKLRHERLEKLAGEEARLRALPKPPLVASERPTDETLCCCCWAVPTDEQVARTNTANVWRR